MTSLSGSSESSGASRITERAVGWLLSRRSSMSIGEPERQTTRVPRKSPTLARRSSSISTFVTVGEHDDDLRRLSLAIVRLPDDREDRLRPAQDHRVVLLQDDRAAAAQVGETGVDPGGDHADQGADDEEAGDGQGQHGELEGPAALVPADRARVEGVQQVAEHRAAEVALLVAAQAEDRDHQRTAGSATA